jgi:hypothetical protein
MTQSLEKSKERVSQGQINAKQWNQRVVKSWVASSAGTERVCRPQARVGWQWSKPLVGMSGAADSSEKNVGRVAVRFDVGLAE